MNRFIDGVSVLGLLAAVGCAAAEPAGWQAEVAASGEVRLRSGQKEVASIMPGLFEATWRGGTFSPGTTPPDQTQEFHGRLTAPGGTVVDTVLRPQATAEGLRLAYTLTPRAEVRLNSLHITLDLPIAQVAGRQFSADGQAGTVPAERGDTHLRTGPAREIALDTAGGGLLRLAFAEATPVLVQDNRQWGPSLSVRCGGLLEGEPLWPAGKSLTVDFTLSAPTGLAVEYDLPVTLIAGEQWVPLAYEPEIEPGSALDFSAAVLAEAPAGRHGHLLARPNGTFAFADSPETVRRFYGVNLCFTAHYIDHEQADRLADRLARLGYNAVRVHHYESELTRSSSSASTAVADIPLGSPPTRTETLARFETPSSEGDHYGQRLRGLLCPPATGEYVFKISSDDEGQLWLGTDDRPETRQLVARVPEWTGVREWGKFPEQTSKPVRLETGRRYYIEALHKEGSGGDHLSVGWQGPGLAFAVIEGASVVPFGGSEPGGIRREVWQEPAGPPVRDSTRLIPQKLDQLDYLLAALAKRGLYITTDLYVSRPVYAAEIWDGADGDVAMDEFKMAVPVNERAFANWQGFVRNLLTHRNPYSGLTYAEDPALAWLSMINEGNVGNFLGSMGERVRADWSRAWNQWLADRYGSAEGLRAAWGADPGGDPAAGSVPLVTNLWGDSPKTRDMAGFCAGVEAAMFARMRAFLRDELHCQALLTNMNAWTNPLSAQAVRASYDYVDDHFYVDHPHFIERPWSLPSRCPNTSPISDGAPGGRAGCFLRLLDKPFTVSEYNYSGPGRYRGVGGILTGCLGALQGWDVIWRFAYSHSRGNLFQPSPAGYFDVVTDPLNQIAERAAICLYLRGDLKPAPHTVAIGLAEKDILSTKTPNRGTVPGWTALAWVTGVGTWLVERGSAPADLLLPYGPGAAGATGGELLAVDPYGGDAGAQVLAQLQAKGWVPAGRVDLKANRLESETGEVSIDAARDVLTLNTLCTQGGYGPEGETIAAADVEVKLLRSGATVWVSSLDGRPIRDSRRLLVCHLTDLQNSGARFGERARKTLLAWGRLPHLVQDGAASVRLAVADAARAKVWALSTSGKRLAQLQASADSRGLVLPLAVRGPDGARLVYEVVIE